RLSGGGELEAGASVLRLDRRESMSLEQVANEAKVPLVVLDDEDQLAVFATHGAFTRMHRSSSSSSAWRSSSRFRSSDRIQPRTRRSSSAVNVFDVRTTIGMELVRGSARSCSTTAKPSTSGMTRSSKMTSGCADRASATPLAPFRAVNTMYPAG